MKYYLTLSIFFFLAINLFAQNKWSIGPVISLGFSGERIYDINANYTADNYFYEIKESKLSPSFGGGFFAERYLGKHWSIGFGFEYNYIQRFDRSEFAYHGPLGNLISYSQERKKLISHQLQAPLQARFYLGTNNKIRPYLSFGGLVTYSIASRRIGHSSYSFGNGEIVEYPFEERYDKKSVFNPIKPFTLSAFYGFGIDFKTFSVEFNYSQSVLKEDSNFYYRPSTNAFFDINSYSFQQTHLTRMLIRYKF